jgi:16S rRNA (cytosine967-C5)-methyltransferase
MPPSEQDRRKNQSDAAGGKTSGAANGSAGTESRIACFQVLRLVDNGRYLDEALRQARHLPDRDRRFVRLLAATCLRRAGQIDSILADLMSRQPSGKQRDAMIILRMGAAQLLFLDTGAHAAVNSTVELMRSSGFDRLTGLTNAVMRRLARETADRLAKTRADENLPDWLRDSWHRQFGKSATAAIMDLVMEPPTLDITAAQDIDSWAGHLDGHIINGHTIRRAFDGDPAELPGFKDGAWWVQDAAAALPATLFGDLAGKDVIDLCAAPGGKTAQLISQGATVTAIDSSAKRLKTLRGNLARLGMKAQCVTADGRSYDPGRTVDAVLIDAPCSATGTLRRRPDILRGRQADDIKTLANLQSDLIRQAATWLKPGGCLVYATCSLQFEEGEHIADSILADDSVALKSDPITTDEAGAFAAAVTSTGTLRLRPDMFAEIGGVDGFFVARFRSVGG